MISQILERRRRRAARIALYGSLVLVGGVAWAARRLAQPARCSRGRASTGSSRDYPNLPEVKLLQEYVRIDTSETTGDEVAGARFLARQLEAAGIPTRIEVVGGRARPTSTPGWTARTRGPSCCTTTSTSRRPIPKEWFSPPFEARIELPWIYGRGVFDMKSVAIAQMLAMIDLKKSGVPLKRSVLFLATSSEERGSRLGVRRLIQLHPEMVRSFWAVLTEGGVVEARSRDDIKFWGTEFAQKRYADLDRLRRRPRAAGGAAPDPARPRAHRDRPAPRRPRSRPCSTAYAPTRDREDLRDLVKHPDERSWATSPPSASCRPTCAPCSATRPCPSTVEEAPGGGYQLLIKLQLLPGRGPGGGASRSSCPAWLLFGLTIELDEPPPPADGSPLDHPVFREIAGDPARALSRTPRRAPTSCPGRPPTPASSARRECPPTASRPS